METTTFNPESISSWARERGSAELSTFVTNRLAILSHVELDLN